jgi:hypothetical protein
MGSWHQGLRYDGTTRRYATMRKIAKNIKIKHKKCQNYKKL